MGRHSTELEVSGAPEDVWRAIATSRGLSSWFLPTEIEGRLGGKVRRFGPGKYIHSVLKITAWEPPKRLVTLGSHLCSTEWTIEATATSRCEVRRVTNFHALADSRSPPDTSLHMLRLHLERFRGQACSPVVVDRWGRELGLIDLALSFGRVSSKKAWTQLIERLGLAQASVGTRIRAPAEAPELGGTVEVLDQVEPGLVLHLDTPAPGLAQFSSAYLRFFLYGASPETVASEMAKNWRDWLAARFPLSAAE